MRRKIGVLLQTPTQFRNNSAEHDMSDKALKMQVSCKSEQRRNKLLFLHVKTTF
jgi:hypothetical protein